MKTVKGFVHGCGIVEYIPAEVRNGSILWPVAIVPEGTLNSEGYHVHAGAYCACDRCRGIVHDNSWGSGGYTDCLSSLDSPWADPEEETQSEALLRETYEDWLAQTQS